MEFCAQQRKDNDKLEWVHGVGPQGSQCLEHMMKEKRVRAGFVQSEERVLEGSHICSSLLGEWRTGRTRLFPDAHRTRTRSNGLNL